MMIENGEGTGGKLVTFIRGTDGSPAVRLGDWLGISLSPDGKWIVSTTGFTDPQAQQRRATSPWCQSKPESRFQS